MTTNNRISSFEEILDLSSFDSSFISEQFDNTIGNNDDDVLFMITTSGQKNEKIKFKNLKKSTLDTSVLLTGDQNINGTKVFNQFCDFKGGLYIDSFLVDEYVYHKGDTGTYIQFETGKINFSAENEIDIDVENKGLNINTSGVSINTDQKLGSLTVSGDAYFDNVFIKTAENTFTKLSPFPEESVNFTLPLVSGVSNYQIDFPKTFQDPPSLSLCVEGSGAAAPLFSIPYVITNISEANFEVSFGAEIPNDTYKIHALAKPTGDSSFRQTKTVSLIENLTTGKLDFTINYPEAFSHAPVLSTTLESPNYIVPYIITEATKESFKLSLTSELPEEAKLHIHATR